MDSPPGGQRQAVAIFQAVSLDRNVLIMDGPTAVLAVASVEALLENSCGRSSSCLRDGLRADIRRFGRDVTGIGPHAAQALARLPRQRHAPHL